MTTRAFNQLSHEVQLAYAFQWGAYLARRWDDVDQAVQLYQVPGVGRKQECPAHWRGFFVLSHTTCCRSLLPARL